MKRDYLDLEWWEHPDGGIDWALIQIRIITVLMVIGTVAIFIYWLMGGR